MSHFAFLRAEWSAIFEAAEAKRAAAAQPDAHNDSAAEAEEAKRFDLLLLAP